jgi:hypothetical protein
MVRRRLWNVVAALLALGALAAHVQGDFDAVRVKLVRSPLPPQQRVSLPIPAADIPGPHLVFIYRVRNTGAEPVTISVNANGRTLSGKTLAPRASARGDVAWLRQGAGATGSIEVRGSRAEWTLDYAELANLHGFSRGAVAFTILPDAAPVTRPPAWTLVACILGLLCVVAAPPLYWGRALPYHALGGVVSLFFGAIVLAPIVSPFHIALAPHTFAGGVLLLGLPQFLGIVARVGSLARRIAAAIGRLPVAARAAAAHVPCGRTFLVAAFIVYAALMWTRVGAYAGGSDQSGYLHSARLLAAGRVRAPVRSVATLAPAALPREAYAPLGFRADRQDELTPTYPIGLPLSVAAVAQLTGWGRAADVTMVLYALAGVLLVFRLAQECGLPATAAAFAALLLATSPLYLFMSLTLMSDTPAMVWAAAAVLAAWRSRRRTAWAIAAGLAVSYGVLVRPTNVLVFAPVAVCLGASPRRWALLATGGIPGVAVLAAYNAAAYGTIVSAGYSSDVAGLFHLANVMGSLRNYAIWLPVLLTPIGILALGIVAVRQSRAVVAVLVTWALAFLVFYAPYAFTQRTWWFLRFILPAFPAFIVSAVWVGWIAVDRCRGSMVPRARAIFERRALGPLFSAAFVALVVAHNTWWGTRLYAFDAGRGERKYFEVAQWARSNLPADAVVAVMQASGALFYYTDFPIVRWDFLRPDTFRHVGAAVLAEGRPLYAVLFPYDLELDAFTGHLHGRWVRAGAIDDVTVWEFAGFDESSTLNVRSVK